MRNLILFALIFSLNLISQEFEVDLSGSMEETVLGAPLYIRVEVRNVSGKGQKIAGTFNYRYMLKGIKGGEAQLWNGIDNYYVPCEGTKINYVPPGWKEVKVEDISQFYIRRKGEIAKDKIKQAGEYRIEVIASPRCNKGVDKEGLLDYNVWHGQLKKEIVIEIKEPEGIDREAYEYFKGYVPLSGERAKEVLEKFPTSTYAGWVLAPFFYNKAPFGNGKQIIENSLLPEEKRDLKIRMKEKGKDGKYVYLSSEEYAARYINLAEQFIKANGRDKNLGAIYAGLSLCYMYLREWEKAYRYGEKSLELEWPIWIYSSYLPDIEKQRNVLKEALEEMMKRGLVSKN